MFTEDVYLKHVVKHINIHNINKVDENKQCANARMQF